MTDPIEDRILHQAQKHVDDGSVADFATGIRRARAVDRAAAIYLEAKIRIETERLIAEAQREIE